MHAGSIQNLVPHAKRAGFIATCLAAAAAAQFGWSQGSGYLGKAVTLAGFCVLASFVVGYAPAFAACAYRQGARAVGHACIALFMVGVLVEAVGAFGFNAAARFAGVETAQHQQTVYTDTRSELERARNDLASMKPTRTPAAISAEMQGIESRPWFSSTANCSSPGSYGNSCRRYIALKGELATAQARAALDARVQKLASEASTREIGQSDVGSQSRVIASVATFQVKPSAEQEYWTFVSVSALFTLFMVLSGLINFAAYGIDPDEQAKPTAAIVPFKPAHPVGSAHVGPTSGPMIPVRAAG